MIILRTWTKQPGNYFCISSKDPDGGWRDEFFKRSQFKMVPRYIKELVEDQCDVYWCCHGFSKPRRLKRYAVMPMLLWADIDEMDPSTLELKPSVLWQSSPGRYAGLWALSEVLSDDEVNKKWTYKIGADKGGWDLTQVLRVPGTQNHKYEKKPTVKLEYDDSARLVYNEKTDILPLLPKSRNTRQVKKNEDARKIFHKYKKYLSPWARREMLSGKPAKGKRSEVFWKLTNELIEAGAIEDEAFTLLWASPWNKFSSRRDGEDQLQREINKVYNNKFDGPEGQASYEEESTIKREEDIDRRTRLKSSFLGAVENENPDWVLYPYLARKHITSVEGAPEVGKSWFCLAAGSAIAEGKIPFPQDGWNAENERGLVIYFDAENVSGNIAQRMKDSGMLTGVTDSGDASPFAHLTTDNCDMPCLGDDDIIEYFEELIEDLLADYKNNNKYPIRLATIIFDTIINFSGESDSNKQGDVIKVMNNLKNIAVTFDCSVVMIRHHGKSLKDKDPMHRGVGSIQFGASARNVVGIYSHPEDESQRIVSIAKTNLAHKHFIRPLVYSLDRMFPHSMDINQRDRTRMVWEGHVDMTDSDFVLSQNEKDERKKEKGKDTELLTDILAELEGKYRINGHAAKIPSSEIRLKVETSNIPHMTNLARELRRLGYAIKGRGKHAYYVRELDS